MKKLALAVAVATAASMGHATISSSTIGTNEIQLYIGTDDIEFDCPAASGLTTGLAFSGTSTISMNGSICLDPYLTGGAGFPLIGVTFALSGTYSAGGSFFDSGSIVLTADTGAGWGPYMTITASPTDSVDCRSGQVGHLGTTGTPPVPVNTTAGVIVPSLGNTLPLPGFWFPPASAGINDAACVTSLMGQRAGLFLGNGATISN